MLYLKPFNYIQTNKLKILKIKLPTNNLLKIILVYKTRFGIK